MNKSIFCCYCCSCCCCLFSVTSIYLCASVTVYVDERSVDVQYSNWTNDRPEIPDVKFKDSCVVVTQHNEWFPYRCHALQRYVCQSQYELFYKHNYSDIFITARCITCIARYCYVKLSVCLCVRLSVMLVICGWVTSSVIVISLRPWLYVKYDSFVTYTVDI